ncbi:MAG: hypothetical protein ACOYNN_01265 [Terrimicrobiaceae bacterium]
MKIPPAISMGSLFSVLILAGCTSPEGRFRPPDPIGYAIFEFFDRGPRNPPASQYSNSDAEYVGNPSPSGQPPSPNSIWVDGTWGTSNGRRVWIPAHWQ